MHRSLRKSENSISSQPLSRQRRHDMERAVAAARNAGESKYGITLVSGHTQEDKNYKKQLDKLKVELRRKQAHIEQQKKRFVHKIAQLPDPTILVERAPSPENVRKALYDEEFHHYWSDIDIPGYRRNTHKTFRYPSNLPTIDAYTLRSKRKVNLWEDAAQETPKVTSVYVPHAPLTPQEESEIQRCYATHLRRPKTVEDILAPKGFDETSALVPAKPSDKKKRTKSTKKRIAALPKSTEITDLSSQKTEKTENSKQVDEHLSTTFITEIPRENYTNEKPTEEQQAEPKEPTPQVQTCTQAQRKSRVTPKPAPVRYSPHKVFVIVENGESGESTTMKPSRTETLAHKPESLVELKMNGPSEPVLPAKVSPKTEVVSSKPNETAKERKNDNDQHEDEDDELIYEVSAAQKMSDSRMVKGVDRSSKLPGILEMVTEGYQET